MIEQKQIVIQPETNWYDVALDVVHKLPSWGILVIIIVALYVFYRIKKK